MRYRIFRNGGHGSSGFNLAGGTVSGPVILTNNPTEPMHVATKNYVDSKISNLGGSDFKSGFFPVVSLPSFSGDAVTDIGNNIVTLSETGISPGSYTKVRTDSKGRITNGYSLDNTDMPEISWNKVTSGKPVSLAGYNITDGLTPNGGTLTGTLQCNVTPADPLHIVNKDYVDSLAANAAAGLSTGDMIRKVATTAPDGFLKCNGGELDKTTYSALYAVIGDVYNVDLQPGSGQPWRQQYSFNNTQSGDITGWSLNGTIPEAMYTAQSIVTKNRIHILGGTGRLDSSIVHTATVNSDGGIGTWTIGTSLPAKVQHSNLVITKNRVYLLGGNGSSSVYTAPINVDGTLGTWTIGTSLPAIIDYAQTFITKNRVYLLGGYGSSSVYTAPINADGTIGTWSVGTSLPSSFGYSQAVVTKNRVYLLGGHNGNAYVATVYTAPINTDGTLGTWSTGTSLPGVLVLSHSLVTKNMVYLFGGITNTGSHSSYMYKAPINADGTIGTWTYGTSLPPTSISQGSLIVTKNKVHILAATVEGLGSNSIYTAPISGGLNDYSPYYDGTLTPTDPTKFKLPDYSAKELSGSYTYIKI